VTKVLSITRTPADFVSGTRHLSIEDRGAYQEVLDQIVILGQDENPPSLPDDDAFLACLMGWPVKKWRETRKRLCEGTGAVLVAAGGRISQARIVEEIGNARSRIDKASRAGEASGNSRRSKAATLRELMTNASSHGAELEQQPKANSKRASQQPAAISQKKTLTGFQEREISTTAHGKPSPRKLPELSPKAEAVLRQRLREIRQDEKLIALANLDTDAYDYEIRTRTGYGYRELAEITGDFGILPANEAEAHASEVA